MNNTKIKNILKEYIDNRNLKSILIDGPWGCGKTHQVNAFIEDYIKKKKSKSDIKSENLTTDYEDIYYVSLFGLETIDEIHTEVYIQAQKTSDKIIGVIKRLLTGASLVSKVIPTGETFSSFTEGLNIQLGNATSNSIKSNCIIVFDDLERISNTITFVNLLGYINKLIMNNCRIICLVNSQEIIESSAFNKFKEKIFDRVYQINETNIDIMNSIFEKYQIQNIELTYDLFENNLRMAKKVSVFYDKIVELFKTYNISIKETKHSELIIFEAAIYTVLIALKNCELDAKTLEPDNINSMIFGENIARNIKYFFKDETRDNDMINIKNLTIKMLYMFLFDDSKPINDYFFSETNLVDEYILKKDFFYLSDKSKYEYFVELENFVLNNEFKWNDVVTLVASVVQYSNYTFSDSVIKKLCKSYIEKYSGETSYLAFKFHLDEVNSTQRVRVEMFVRCMKEAIILTIEENNVNQILDFKNTGNYLLLTDFIRTLNHSSEPYGKDRMNKILINERFYLPDLAGDITSIQWDYCHTIAKYARKYSLTNDFLECAKIMIQQNPTSKSLTERLLALINYNFAQKITIEELMNFYNKN